MPLLARVASLAGENQAASAMRGRRDATLNADGTGAPITFPATERIGYMRAETGHNIPDVFFNFLNQRARSTSTAATAPASSSTGSSPSATRSREPYWTKHVDRGQSADVMVQAFQRQVLTYIP